MLQAGKASPPPSRRFGIMAKIEQDFDEIISVYGLHMAICVGP